MSQNWSAKVQGIFSKKDKKVDKSPSSSSSKSTDFLQTSYTAPKEISSPFIQSFESSSVSSSGYFSQDSPRFEEKNLQFKIDHLKSEFQTLSDVDQRLHKQLLALNNVIQDIRDFQRTTYGTPRNSRLETCVEEEPPMVASPPKKPGHRRLQSEDFTAVRSPNLITQTEFRVIAENGNSSHHLEARTRY